MGHHEKSRRRMEQQFHDWSDQFADRPEVMDQVLDQYLDAEQRASEWDADRWALPDETVCGLDPTTPPSSWAAGLRELERRAERDPRTNLPQHWPTEPAKWDL